ncbi:MAG: adenylosuccinate lyase [Actinobacteria bacterium]|nr:MAG: adenylosuccinate lyase [Actinomycetota bacterium]
MIPRYTLPEMGAVWDERAKYRHWLRIEVLAAEAWTKLGVVPEAAMAEIRANAAEVDPAHVEELEATLQHDVVAFLTALGEKIGPASRWIHYGMTSSDLLDTALALQLRESSGLLLAKTQGLLDVLKRRAVEFRDTVCVGRTHGVHAEPTTFGLKLAVWAFEVARDRERLERARDAVSVGKIAGPVGTYASVDPSVEEYVCAQLGLKGEDAATQVVQRDRHAEYVSALAITASTLDKIATEIRHLQRTEVREAEEPFKEGQKGSSAMPHKRNPIMCERISGLARVVRAAVVPGLENVVLWHERDISHSSTERVFLPDASIALDYMMDLTTQVIGGMRVYPERMLANLNASGGLVYSQAVLLALVEAGCAREEAYGIVQSAGMRTWEQGGAFRDHLLEVDAVRERVGEAKLDAIMDPSRYLVHSDQIFKRLERL